MRNHFDEQAMQALDKNLPLWRQPDGTYLAAPQDSDALDPDAQEVTRSEMVEILNRNPMNATGWTYEQCREHILAAYWVRPLVTDNQQFHRRFTICDRSEEGLVHYCRRK